MIYDIARRSGCTDSDALLETIHQACEQRQSPIERVFEKELVEDEERFFQLLAGEMAMEYVAEPKLDLSEPMHAKFPAKIALKHRVLPSELGEEEVRLMTYDPFDWAAK